MLECMKAYRDIGYEGVLRPDHVPTMEGDSNDHAMLPGDWASLRHRLHQGLATSGLRRIIRTPV
ncbi:MAG: mannonate dehydratase [Caldilineaceae bacterium]